MTPMPVIQFDKPLNAVKILNDSSDSGDADMLEAPRQSMLAEQTALVQELEMQKKLHHEGTEALQGIIAKLGQLYDEIFAGHNEAIARLSVEIARKVLMRNITEGDYEIESIVKEALKNAPQSASLVVRLNPQDLTDLRKLQDAGEATVSGIELTADANIGRAECVVESSKGVMKLLIDEHLEQISKALAKAG